jgi:hypothetical protein
MQRHRVTALLLLAAGGASSQWLRFPTPGTPRTRDGKPDLTAPAPRMADGKPDLSGVWHVQPTSLAEMKRLYGESVGETNVPGMEADTISKYAINILLDFKPAESPMRPDAAKLLSAHVPGTNPADRCLPIGLPAAGLVSEFSKIVQSPRTIVILYESDNTHRQIYTDGRALPGEIEQPAWLGYSVGRWERDTLIVESTGFNDKTWLDLMGHPHSESLHLTERYRRRDFGHMDVTVTVDDPPMYTRPFTIQFIEVLQPDTDILETFCNENEKDHAHSVSK